MPNYYQELNVTTGESFEVRDLTAEVRAVVEASGISEGTVTVTSMHTTCALSVNENEPRLFEDLREFLLGVAPPAGAYKHNDLHLRVNIPPDEPENAHAHLIAMLLGNSETLAVHRGAPVLGRHQSVLLLEMDGPRERGVAVQVIGMN